MKPFEPKHRTGSRRGCRASGFTLLELCIVMAIAIIMTVISLPMLTGALNAYKVNSAVASVTGAINTTRYKALQNGYPYEISFTTSNSQYQVLNDVNNSGTFANVGNPLPFSITNNLLGSNITLVFHPGGSVQCPACSAGQVDASGNFLLTVTYSNQPTETITVSPYGKITVTP